MEHDTGRATSQSDRQSMKSKSRQEQEQLESDLSPKQEVDRLFNSISQEHVSDSTLDKLKKVLGKRSTLSLLKKYRVGESNFLQEAAISLCSTEVIKLLAENCPKLAMWESKGKYAGRTALHILVSSQNLEGAKALLDSITDHKAVKNMLKAKAVGSLFNDTVMMGQLPLSIAALTFNLKMVDLLLDKKAKLYYQNDMGDTVLHSLVRYAAIFEDKQEEVVRMMKTLHQKLETHSADKSPQAEAKTLWLIENKDGLTVMRLAADLALPSVFKMVLLELGGVYSHLNRRDGLFNFLLFDVVEIDPVARVEWKLRNPTVSNKPVRLDHRRDRSVLETICETKKVEKACGMLNTPVIRAIIKSKWGYYIRLLAVMIFFHFSFMVALTAYAIVKSEVIRAAEAGQPSSSTEKAFVSGMAVIVFIVALVLVVMEIIRWVNGQPWSITIHHHNGSHRLELCLIALCLIADSVWYWAAGPDNNFFLIPALLIGWWFTSFFLRPFKKFSFYTVMLQRVIVGDMLRFSSVIIPELLAFSVAMHMIFVVTPGPLPEGFEHPGYTLITMFKLMLGMGDFEMLYSTSHSWLAITLFVFFVITNNILMFNTLIAMMASTCALVSEEKVKQWRLQRLSVILFIESSIPCLRYKHNSGDLREANIYQRERQTVETETRYFIKVKSFIPTLDDMGTKSHTESGGISLPLSSIMRSLMVDKTFPQDYVSGDKKRTTRNSTATAKSDPTVLHGVLRFIDKRRRVKPNQPNIEIYNIPQPASDDPNNGI